MNSDATETVRLVLLLAGGAILAAGWLWSLRLRQGTLQRPTAGALTIVSRLGVEHRRTLYVVRAGQQHYLIGSSENGLSLLSPVELAPSEEVHS